MARDFQLKTLKLRTGKQLFYLKSARSTLLSFSFLLSSFFSLLSSFFSIPLFFLLF